MGSELVRALNNLLILRVRFNVGDSFSLVQVLSELFISDSTSSETKLGK